MRVQANGACTKKSFLKTFKAATMALESNIKSFQNVQFPKMEDKYDVKFVFNAKSGSLSLELLNKTNTKAYYQLFNKESITEITARAELSTENLSKIIIDQLSSTEFIQKCIRVFRFADIKQGMN